MPNYEQRPPAGELEGIKVQVADLWPIVPDNNFRRAALEAMLGNFARRMIQDAVSHELPKVQPSYWEEKAKEMFSEGRISEGIACRQRAWLIREYPESFGIASTGLLDAIDDALTEHGVKLTPRAELDAEGVAA